jgi:hypothetical protein
LKNQLGKEAVRQRFSLLELFNTKKQLTLYTGAELGLFIRGVKINITRYNICSVVIVETGRVKIS